MSKPKLTLNETTDSALNVSIDSAPDQKMLDKKEVKEGPDQPVVSPEEAKRLKDKKNQKRTFWLIVVTLILMMLIIAIRSQYEKQSDTEPDVPIVDIPPTLCGQIDDFMKYEPCWRDYGPKREVDKVRDLYRYTENGGGKINSETLNINGQTFANPMLEILN